MSNINLDDVHPADLIERLAWADLIAAAPATFGTAVGVAAPVVGGALAIRARGIPSTIFNRVLGLGIAEPATEADVDAIVQHYDEHRIETSSRHNYERCATLPQATAE